MASFNTPIVTTQGLTLLKSAIAGTETLTFTKLIFSADDYTNSTDTQVSQLTDISSKDMVTTPQSFTDANGNVKVRAVGYNQSTSQAFNIKTYALYATNKEGNELLFAVSTSQTADFVPAYNGKQLNQVAYTFNFSVASSNNITFSDTHDIAVTQADLASINASIQSVQNSLDHIDLSSAVKQAQSYTDSSVSSLSSQVVSSVASNASAIASNATSINSLSNTALKTIGSVPTSDLASIPNDGIYSLAGKSYDDAPYSPIYGTITQVGTGFAVKTQIIISNIGQYYYRVVNSWGIEGWYQLSNESDISNLNSSLSSMATQATSLSSSVSANSSAIASNATNIATLQSSVATNSNAISSNASLASQAINQINANISSTKDDVNNLRNDTVVFRGQLNDGDDLNNLISSPDGYYECWNKNVKNMPVSYTSWFIVKVVSHAAITYMTYVNDLGVRYYRTAAGYPQKWGAWQQLATENDVNQINANIAQAQSNAQSYADSKVQFFSTASQAQSYAQNAPAGTICIATGN